MHVSNDYVITWDWTVSKAGWFRGYTATHLLDPDYRWALCWCQEVDGIDEGVYIMHTMFLPNGADGMWQWQDRWLCKNWMLA